MADQPKGKKAKKAAPAAAKPQGCCCPEHAEAKAATPATPAAAPAPQAPAQK